MRMLGIALIGIALMGCGGEVVVLDEEDPAAFGDAPGDPASGCVRCDEGDCGMCAGMYGASHRCGGDIPPATGCYQLGSLFDDGYEHYVCWSCN